jgi:hypothetical protein
MIHGVSVGGNLFLQNLSLGVLLSKVGFNGQLTIQLEDMNFRACN